MTTLSLSALTPRILCKYHNNGIEKSFDRNGLFFAPDDAIMVPNLQHEDSSLDNYVLMRQHSNLFFKGVQCAGHRVYEVTRVNVTVEGEKTFYSRGYMLINGRRFNVIFSERYSIYKETFGWDFVLTNFFR